MEEIKRHHEELDAGRPDQRPACPRWSEKEDCRDQVIFKGEVVRTGLKVGTEDWLPEVRLRQCRCHRHGYFREYVLFVLPNKHYAAFCVDEALKCAAESTDIEEFCGSSGIQDLCTPLRWIAQWTVCLEQTANVLQTWFRRLSSHQPGVLVPVVNSPPAWSYRSAWDCLNDALAEWPVPTAPPLSYLALKA